MPCRHTFSVVENNMKAALLFLLTSLYGECHKLHTCIDDKTDNQFCLSQPCHDCVCTCINLYIIAAVHSITIYDARLTGGSAAYQGTVEVLTHRGWLPVCSYSWDSYAESRVLCRQLGYDVMVTPSIQCHVMYTYIHC